MEVFETSNTNNKTPQMLQFSITCEYLKKIQTLDRKIITLFKIMYAKF